MERMKIAIDAGNLEDLQKLLGTFDENLNIITRELGVEASVDGVKLKISGPETEANLAARVLEGILKLIRAGKAWINRASSIASSWRGRAISTTLNR